MWVNKFLITTDYISFCKTHPETLCSLTCFHSPVYIQIFTCLHSYFFTCLHSPVYSYIFTCLHSLIFTFLHSPAYIHTFLPVCIHIHFYLFTFTFSLTCLHSHFSFNTTHPEAPCIVTCQTHVLDTSWIYTTCIPSF